MLQKFKKHMLLKSVLLLSLVAGLFSFTAMPGGDVYQIYLNNRLVLEERVFDQKDVKTLELDKNDAAAQMTVMYSHCGAIGKGRHITFKDASNRVLKVWRYEDGSNKMMSCSVKDLMSIGADVSGTKVGLYYSSAELPEGKLLAKIVY